MLRVLGGRRPPATVGPLGGKRRALVWLARLAATLAVALLLAAGSAGALLLHLNLPASRRVTADLVGRGLADLFQGQLIIGRITKISPFEVQAEDIVVRDPARRVVLKVSRLTAQADLLDILRRLVTPGAELSFVIDHVRIERAEADIIPDADGLPTLARALTPRPTPGDAAAGADAPDVKVRLPAIEIGQAYARGSVSGSPTLETELSAVRGSVLATSQGATIDVSRFALVARGVGGADARGVASLHIRAPGAIWGSFDGYMGDVQFGSALRYEHESLDLKLDVPRAEPAAMRALVSQWPLLMRTEARARLTGKPPDFELTLSSVIGSSSRVSARGALSVADPFRLQLEIEGRRLDLRALAASSPATSFDVDTELGLHRRNGEWIVDVGGALHGTQVENVVVPSIDFSGSTAGGAFVGEAQLHDFGLPVQLTFTVFPDGKLQLEAEARRVNLAKVERIKPYFQGTGTADAQLRASLARGVLEGSLTLDVHDLTYQDVSLQDGRLLASVKGPTERLDALALEARLTGKQLGAGRFRFEDVRAAAFGPVKAPTVTVTLKDTTGPSFDARAQVALGTPLSVRGLSLGVSRSDVEIRAQVAQLDLAEERVLVRELRLYGATGELQGNAEIRPDSLSVTAQGHNLDLSALSRVLGLPRGTLEGRANVNVDVLAGSKLRRGTLELSVDKAAIAGLSGISGQLSARLDGDALSGSATGQIDSFGAFSASWDTELGGPPTELASFEKATGRATLSLEDVTLEYLGQLRPELEADFTGHASLTLDVTRREPDAVPDLELSARTRDLRVQLTRKGETPLVLSGIELSASAAHEGATGNTTASVAAEQGAERLVAASADMTLDLKAALAGAPSLTRQLEERPLLAKLVVSELDLESLPGPLRAPGVRGALRLEGMLRGSIADPIASVSVRASSLRFSGNELSEPLDVCGSAEYGKESGAFSAGAEVFLPTGFDLRRGACSGRRVATVHLNGTVPFDAERALPDWSGTALIALEDLPLSTIEALADARVTGNVTGKVLVDRSRGTPAASAELELKDVRADRLAIGSGAVSVRASASHARAEFSLAQAAASVAGQVDAGIAWSSGLPALDDAQAVDASLRATQLPASVLEPLLSDVVSELRGVVNGQLDLRLSAADEEQARHLQHVGGQVTLRDSSFILQGLGFRLRDVGFTASARRVGRQTHVEIPLLTASAGSRSRNMSAKINLQLEGLTLNAGQAGVSIRQLPLVVDGITRAHADADVELTLARMPEKMLVDTRFSFLDAKLPPDSPRDLISLSSSPNVVVLQPLAEPKGARAQDDLPWHFVIHLGERAKLQRGALLDLPLRGDPNVVLARDLGVTGTIYLMRGGAIQMLGKIFVIEGGGVIFDTPDPKDPRLDVQASWRTPDGDTLFVYVSGTLSKPNLRFDRPKEQAWAMLLGSGDASELGLSALDMLLTDTPLARVQLRKTAGKDDSAATYTAAYRLNERVIVEGNYQEASSSGSDGGDDSGNMGAAVDWRISKSWSLRGQLGTIGTGVDLIYQYRY